MSTFWYYSSSFTRVATNPSFTTFGYPSAANYNAFSSTPATPFLANMSAFCSGVITNRFVTENLDRSFYPQTAQRLNVPGDATGYIVSGGFSFYPNTLGVGLAIGAAATSPAEVPYRFILLPNSHTTADGSANPSGTVIDELFFPVPLDPNAANSNIIGADVMGTNILNHTAQALYHTTNNVYVYPFIMPNAWKFSGTDWYVDISSPIWWPNDTFNSDTRKHLITADTEAPVPTIQAGLLSSPFCLQDGYGFEDLANFDGVSWAGPQVDQWKDYNDLVINMGGGTWL